MKFEVGMNVTWISSNTRKRGVITDVVPAGRTPREIGKPKAGGGGMYRDHETYVVRGRKLTSRGEEYGPKADYWPLVSLLETIG